MRSEIIEKMLSFRKSHTTYALASIVRRKAPSSGKPGDHALITADGYIHGWIGGGCTRGIVLKEALLSLKDGKSRYVAISKDQLIESYSNTKVYNMTCQSGGQVEVYIEPMLPKPHLLIFGQSHIGMALSKLAKAMDYQVTAVMNTADPTVYPAADHIHDISTFSDVANYKDAYIVVCSQGEGDVTALLKALSIESNYIGFVASMKKGQSVFTDLRQHGITFDQLKKIKTPAGIDIGGKLPEEAAVSILAQIIQLFRDESDPTSVNEDSSTLSEMPNDDYYLNPVCNIPIQKSTAKHVLQHKGTSVYFCCDGCKVSFEMEPEKYIS